jgi:hypothetical protein
LWWIGPSTAERVLVFATLTNLCISTLSLALYLYTAELYPTRVRALGTSTATAWLRLASILGPQVVGFVIAGGGLGNVPGVRSGCAVRRRHGGVVCHRDQDAGAGGDFAVTPRAPKRKRASAKPASPNAAAPPSVPTPPQGAPSEISFSNLSLHALFEQQAADMLERADLDKDQKQSILLAMNCPCCGAGGPSFSFKLKRT